MNLRDITEHDHLPISILIESSFGRPDLNLRIAELRSHGRMALELVAEEAGGRPIGHIAFSTLDDHPGWSELVLVSVSPEYQRRGTGSEIIRYGLDRARRTRTEAVAVVGDPEYFSRFGFSLKAGAALGAPFPPGRSLLYPISPAAIARVSAPVTSPARAT